MMHVEFTALMSAVLDHEASATEVQRLHEHLAGCRACAQTWATWRSLDSLLAGAPLLTPPADFVLGVSLRLEQRRRQTRRRRWLGSGLLLVWAALIAAVWLVAGACLVWGITHPEGIGQLASSGTQTVASISGILHGLRAGLTGVGVWQLSLGLGFYLGLTAIVAAVWFWLMAHKSGWSDALSLVHDASA